ncbi:MAG TPA: carboxyl transferase domain-containing protein [Burkholderiaceae bacterium]|nr:carboxyl transferase domain-containing protein [Burkholderiaceae bacterium]
MSALVDHRASVQGAVTAIEAEVGARVRRGAVLLRLESMKMEFPVEALADGVVRAVHVQRGDAVDEGDLLIDLAPLGDAASRAADQAPPRAARADLDELAARRALLDDAARPQMAAARHAQGRRSARENLAALFDEGTFVEYGAFAVAAQRGRRSLDDLQKNTPADGLVTGTGLVHANDFGEQRARCAAMAYDYSVLAGTQGENNHRKSDRLLELAAQQQLPFVLFAEGGGGRPGDVDSTSVSGLHCTTFRALAALSGRVPTLGLVEGYCFAGNAALLGSCDLVIATRAASIGMGGPAMIEGGGLGVVAPDDVGPAQTLANAGAIDLLVDDEAHAVREARRILAWHQGALPDAGAADQRALRDAIPLGRNAVFDPRAIIETIADRGSVIELRAPFGPGVVTVLARLAGHPVAIAATNPRHLAGALDVAGCDKLARFMQLADAAGHPLVTLVDTPGFMVGPAVEAQGMMRHAGRVFVTAAALRVPVVSVVLRRGFGLGAMAFTAGHFHAPVATAAWPQAEFGPMGLEGAVRLGFRKELAAVEGAEREALFERLLGGMRERGRALNIASHLEIDDVIDPAATRDWLLRVLATARRNPLPPRRSFVDTW